VSLYLPDRCCDLEPYRRHVLLLDHRSTLGARSGHVLRSVAVNSDQVPGGTINIVGGVHPYTSAKDHIGAQLTHSTLYEIKHDGHPLDGVADDDGSIRLLSRNGYERSRQFGPVFADLAQLGRQIVLDGEIAVPDERGVTHLDDLSAAMQRRDTAGLAYFAFDLLHLDDVTCAAARSSSARRSWPS
jgi:hypothetical protein